jgi:serine/threonine protein kinase
MECGVTGSTGVPGVRPLRPGDPVRLGEYELLGVLGEGGQGAVFLGRKAGGGPSDEYVAIKLLHAGLSTDSPARARFVRELETAKRVARFCTAQVLDADVAGDHPYIVSEYVAGRSLHALVIEEGRRGGGALERLAIATLTALSAIHQAGIVHRDFKPHNILLGSDGPRVIDFGIARGLSTAGDTQNIGTPAYMAPEQFKGERPGPAADMFAWGTTMVFAATGRPAFGNDETAAVMHRIVYEEPDLGGLPSPLREVVATCLAKDPARRPTARDAQQQLMGAGGALPGIGTPQPSAIPPLSYDGGRRHGSTPLDVPLLGAAGVPADAFTSTPYSAPATGPWPVGTPTPPAAAGSPTPPPAEEFQQAVPAPEFALAAQDLPLPAARPDPPAQSPSPPGSSTPVPSPPSAAPPSTAPPSTAPPFAAPPPSPYATRPGPDDSPERRRRRGLLTPVAAGLALSAVVAAGTIWAATRGGEQPGARSDTTEAAASAGVGTADPSNQSAAGAGRLNGGPSPDSTSLSTAPSRAGGSAPPGPRRRPGQPAPQPTTGGGGGGGNSSPPARSNPYTAAQVCNSGGHGSGYYVQRSSAFTGGRVYQLYNSSGYNCVVTLKTTNVGTKSSVWAQLTREDGGKATDSGSFGYYAGPVFLSAKGQCVKYAGGTSSGSASAPWGNCG